MAGLNTKLAAMGMIAGMRSPCNFLTEAARRNFDGAET
jgi:hypothetical protein